MFASEKANDSRSRPLYDEIREFRRQRTIIGPGLILLGLIGLFFPLLPGLILFAVGLSLVFPREAQKLLETIRSALHRGE